MKKKIGLLTLFILFIYFCRPLSESEKNMDWLWYEVGFWPVLETEIDIESVELEKYNLKIEEYEPFQFSHAEMKTCAFAYGEKCYVLSPETGLIFEDGWFLIIINF